MDTLPVDVLPDIAKHLPVKDLAACCAVSICWRDAFGSDEVWKCRCDVSIEEYLRKTRCRVEPKFMTPESEGTTLSPIGRWRTAYMREVHLRRNWINGNCVENNFSVPPECHGMWFFNNDLIILMVRNLIELIDTTVNPSICVAQYELPFKYPFYQYKVLRGDTVIIWNSCETGNTVIVIEVNTDTNTLSEKRKFTVGEDCEMSLCSFVLVNNVFLSNDNDRMYVGNFENGTILKTESNPLSGGYLYCLNSNENCEDVIVVAGELKGNRQHYFIYSVKELRFFKFTQTRESNYELSCAVVNNLFALFSYEGELDVYDYHSTCLMYHIQLPRYYLFSSRILGDTLIFVTKESKLMQVSLITHSVRCLHSGVSDVEYVGEYHTGCRLLLIKRGNETGNLWFIGSEPLVFMPKINQWGLESVNQTFSKMLISKPDSDFGQWTVLDLW